MLRLENLDIYRRISQRFLAWPSEACGCPNKKTSSVVAARPRSLLLFFTMHLYQSRKTILLRTENAGHICILLPYAAGSHIRRFNVKIHTTPATKLSRAGQLANRASSGNPLPIRQGFARIPNRLPTPPYLQRVSAALLKLCRPGSSPVPRDL